MTQDQKWYALAAALILGCGFLAFAAIFGPGVFRLSRGAAGPTPDYDATLQSLIAQATGSPPAPTPGDTPAPPFANKPMSDEPGGKIVFTCQIYKVQSSEQICVMNADGIGQRDLTGDPATRHFYPSLAPDGLSVVYSQYREAEIYEIMEIDLAGGSPRRLTNRLGALTGPEVSPDGKSIVFMRSPPASDQYQIWIMDRDGGNPHRLFDTPGWDPTWSPHGDQILFASDRDGAIQLYAANLDGSEMRRVTDLPATRGRSDWSPQGLITTYSGESWKREIFVMRGDGSDVRQVSPAGGNSQGPTFSPDGVWIAFAAYFDKPNDIHGCEIYVMRVDGTDLRRLTNNDYCDYQPRWGP
jgi:TolB protein